MSDIIFKYGCPSCKGRPPIEEDEILVWIREWVQSLKDKLGFTNSDTANKTKQNPFANSLYSGLPIWINPDKTEYGINWIPCTHCGTNWTVTVHESRLVEWRSASDSGEDWIAYLYNCEHCGSENCVDSTFHYIDPDESYQSSYNSYYCRACGKNWDNRDR
jgi:hypothetical protein